MTTLQRRFAQKNCIKSYSPVQVLPAEDFLICVIDGLRIMEWCDWGKVDVGVGDPATACAMSSAVIALTSVIRLP